MIQIAYAMDKTVWSAFLSLLTIIFSSKSIYQNITAEVLMFFNNF